MLGVDLGTGAALGGEVRTLDFFFVGGIEIQNALAGFALNHFLAGAHVVVGLRPQHHLAGHAFLIAHFGEAGAAELHDALVVAECVWADAGAQLVALGVPFRQQFLVFHGALAGLLFFSFDFGGFRFEFGLGGLDVLFAQLGVDHQVEDFVLVGANFLLGELDLLHERLVLVIRLDG